MAKQKHHEFNFDLIIVGSGAGGGVAAHIAQRLGKSVAIIEEEKIGGECPNFGCVPTKALLKASALYDEAQHANKYGVRIPSVAAHFPTVKKWKDKAVLRTGTSEGEEAFEADGITVINGRAHFIGPHEVSVGKKRYRAKKFLISTGTHSFIPPIEGLSEAGYLTYREAQELSKLPQSLFIIGGGPIGCEFAQIFSDFGSEVHVGEYAPQLIANEDKEVGQLVGALFEERGIKVHTDCEVFKVEKDRSKKVVYYKKNGKHYSARVDHILVTTGKRPNTDIGLENAGVKYTPRGIKTNLKMQTSAKHIYASGDVVGPFAFTHMASYQSRIAAHNMFKREKIRAQYHAVPRCVFTHPEVAAVGMTEKEAHEQRLKVKVNAVPISIIGRSNTSDQRAGFVKVITNEKGVLLGACIVAPRAGEMMQELGVAVHNRLKAQDVAATIHAFPTWSEAVRIACAGI